MPLPIIKKTFSDLVIKKDESQAISDILLNTSNSKIHCEYCRNPIDKSERNCFSCGASNKFYKLIPVQKISACDRYEACGFNPFM